LEELAVIPLKSADTIWSTGISHLSRTFKLSNDECFEEKFWDVIGLYLNPPDKALVLCSTRNHNAKRWSARNRVLPLGIGHIRTETHDYVRHGTPTPAFAGAGSCLPRSIISRLIGRKSAAA
jgi:hypothetical protein